MEKKVWFSAVFCFLFAFILSGCSLTDGQDAGQSMVGKSPDQKAQIDFYSYVDQVYGTDSDVKNTIQLLAMEAAASGDTNALITYLASKNLIDIYNQVVDNNELQKPTSLKMKTFSQGTIKSRLSRIARMGDILVTQGGGGSIGSGVNFLIPGDWKHSGMVDKKRLVSGNDYCIMSAGQNMVKEDNTAAWKWYRLLVVGYESVIAYDDKSRVDVIRVVNQDANEVKATAAVNYCKRYIGYNYNLAPGLSDMNNFYCSKIIYVGWKSQGVILPSGAQMADHCSPSDLYRSIAVGSGTLIADWFN